MHLSELTAISPLDGRYAKKTAHLRDLCSEYGLIRFRLLVEIKWLQALSFYSDIPEINAFTPNANTFLEKIYHDFNEQDALRVKEIESKTNHDVKAVEYFLKEKLELFPECATYKEFVHFACTSEDINNIAYALILKTLRDEHCLPLMEKVIEKLSVMAKQYAATPLLSRTHGQSATPTTLGKELANFVFRLQQQKNTLAALPIFAKCNGAVGNFNAHIIAYPEVNWPQLSKEFLTHLGLTYHPYTTQIEPHDFIADICLSLSHFNTILIDFARDTWGYISLGYFTQKKAEHEVGSSTMPHKINPIDFENAEGNLGIANALLQHFANKLPISRWQRDLSDSTVLRNLGMAFSYAFLAYQALSTGLQKLNVNEDFLRAELQQHWEVLAEPIQTVMRRYGIENPYEQLKAITRGQTITQQALHNFIKDLALPESVKHDLLQLTPENYIGLAEKLAKEI